MSKKKMKPISIFEIVWYILTGAVAIWGLVYVILGLVAQFYPATDSNNPIKKASDVIAENFGLGFLYWGLIIIGIAVVAAVFVLCITAKTADREVEKATRRAARLAQTETPAPEVIDAEVKEAPKAE